MLCRGAMTQSRLRGWQIGVHEYISLRRRRRGGGGGLGRGRRDGVEEWRNEERERTPSPF